MLRRELPRAWRIRSFLPRDTLAAAFLPPLPPPPPTTPIPPLPSPSRRGGGVYSWGAPKIRLNGSTGGGAEGRGRGDEGGDEKRYRVALERRAGVCSLKKVISLASGSLARSSSLVVASPCIFRSSSCLFPTFRVILPTSICTRLFRVLSPLLSSLPSSSILTGTSALGSSRVRGYLVDDRLSLDSRRLIKNLEEIKSA